MNEGKLCPKGKAAAMRKFDVYPSAYANMYASAVCSGKVKPGGKKKSKPGGKKKRREETLYHAVRRIIEFSELSFEDQRSRLERARKAAFQAAHRGEGRRSKQQIMNAYRKRLNQINAKEAAAQKAAAQETAPQKAESRQEMTEKRCWKGYRAKRGSTPYAKGSCVKVNEAKSPAWQRKAGKNPSGGLNKAGVASYRKANPGSKLKTAVTTKPSKLKKGSKAAKRRKSFCSRMGGMKKRLTSAKTASDPNSRINKALRKWNC